MAFKNKYIISDDSPYVPRVDPVRVLVCRSVPNTRISRPEDSSNLSDTSPHLKLCISVSVRIPKYVERISHIEWTRARAEFVPKSSSIIHFLEMLVTQNTCCVGLVSQTLLFERLLFAFQHFSAFCKLDISNN